MNKEGLAARRTPSEARMIRYCSLFIFHSSFYSPSPLSTVGEDVAGGDMFEHVEEE